MMMDELTRMLDKFEAGSGKRPTKILCGELAFQKLRREAFDDLGTDRYLEPNIDTDGCVARFMGIPVQVVHNTNAMEADKIYILSEPAEEVYQPYHPYEPVQWFRRDPYKGLIYDDIVEAAQEAVHDFRVKRDDAFAAHYYGRWVYENTVSENARYTGVRVNREEEADISDDDLMAVLNGGGFNAVA